VNESDKLVEASERLTSIFGCWPSFHDAEVIEFNLWRGDFDADAQRYVFPTLTTKIHLWELTSDLDARGYYILRHQTLVTLRFHDISELHMQGFNHQNAIFGLSITSAPVDGFPQRMHLEFEPVFGVTATFYCLRVEVLEAQPLPDAEQKA
jgi:immunity protein 50 of polymorphic toxin system